MNFTLLSKAFFLPAGPELSFRSTTSPSSLLPFVHQEGQHVVLILFLKPRCQNMPIPLISPFSKGRSEDTEFFSQ